MLLPYSIVTISIVTALLPHLSKLAMENKVEDVRLQLIRAIRMCGVVTVPSAVALLAFGPLITEVLFFGISLEDSRYIGYVLSALSLGLVAFSINLILIRGFNAFEDTKTQVVSIFIINLISVGLSYLFLEILPSDLVTVGLGVAFSVSYILGLFITIYLLRKHTARIDFSAVRSQHLRLLIASLIAMAPFYLLAWRLDWVNTEFETIKSLAHLLVVLGGGGSLFLLLANLFKVSEVNSAKSYLRSRLLKR
jgi:putative peptidoglycan lipid II flippase